MGVRGITYGEVVFISGSFGVGGRGQSHIHGGWRNSCIIGVLWHGVIESMNEALAFELCLTHIQICHNESPSIAPQPLPREISVCALSRVAKSSILSLHYLQNGSSPCPLLQLNIYYNNCCVHQASTMWTFCIRVRNM